MSDTKTPSKTSISDMYRLDLTMEEMQIIHFLRDNALQFGSHQLIFQNGDLTRIVTETSKSVKDLQ